jgi:glycosyltransferase involved in cell wall biosynthesis
VKQIDTILKAAAILNDRAIQFSIHIVGEPILEDDFEYLNEMRELVSNLHITNQVTISGGVAYEDVPELYRSVDVLINLSKTGSLDKVVLEAMASGIHVLTSNQAYKGIVSHPFFVKNNPQMIADSILQTTLQPPRDYSSFVMENHSLKELSAKIDAIVPMRDFDTERII